MIKAFIFDLDGVLVKTKDMHFHALNLALKKVGEQYVLTYEEHLEIYDGLPTKEKLKLITAYKDLPVESYDKIYKTKQDATAKLLDDITPNPELRKSLVSVSEAGYKIGIVSNSIQSTIEKVCNKLGINDLVDVKISTEQVSRPKPAPDGYIRAMEYFGISPDEAVIFEDSLIGQRAALASGGRLAPVDSPDILGAVISKVIRGAKANTNIVVPMAGEGLRFVHAGYKDPKPMISINGIPMIAHVIGSIKADGLYTFIVQQKHVDQYRIDRSLSYLAPGSKIVVASTITSGAAVSVMLARQIINNDQRLIIANSDQLVDVDWNFEMKDGAILLFKDSHPKWSFAKISNDLVIEVAEKNPISDNATCGIYIWKHGKDFVSYATQMIDSNDRTNNEFYVCPIFNYAISDGLLISPVFVDKMTGLGTPEDLENFLKETND